MLRNSFQVHNEIIKADLDGTIFSYNHHNLLTSSLQHAISQIQMPTTFYLQLTKTRANHLILIDF